MSAVVEELPEGITLEGLRLAEIEIERRAAESRANALLTETVHAKTVETLAIGEVLDDLLLADPFLVASEAAAYAVLAKMGEDPVNAFVAAQSLLPRSSSIFLRGMAAGMAFLRSAQLLHAGGENNTRPLPLSQDEESEKEEIVF